MKNIPKLLQDKKFVFDFFSKHLSQITNNKNLVIKKIDTYPIKESIKPNRFHLVKIYNIFLINKKDLESKCKKIKIVCSADSNGSRKKTYHINKYLFSKKISIPKPLFYTPKLKAFFIKALVVTTFCKK
jgi:hypothetical protein